MYFDPLHYIKMSQFLSSKEEHAIINTSRTLVNVSYKDDDQAIHTIILRVISNFIDKKSTLIISSDSNIQSKLQATFQAFSLSDIGLKVSMQHSVTESDLHSVRERCTFSQYKENVNPDYTFHFHHLHEKVTAYYHNLRNVKIWNDKTWREILDGYLTKSESENSNILHSLIESDILDFDETEFDTIYQNIADAIFIYERDFEYLSQHQFSDNLNTIKNKPEDIHQLSYAIFNLHEQAQNIAERYGHFLSEIERLFVKTASKYSMDVLDRLAFLTFSIGNLNKNPENTKGFLHTFSGAYKENLKTEQKIIAEVNGLIIQLYEKKILVNQVPVKVITEASATLEYIKSEIEVWQNKMPELTSDYIKSVNKLNYHDSTLDDLEKDVQLLLDQINTSGIFNQKFELNTLSVKKQAEHLTGLIYDLEVMSLNIQKNLTFYQWVSFLQEIDEKSNIIIKSLKIFDPSEWLILFEVWYYSKILENHINYFEINEDMYENYLHFSDKKSENITNESKNEWLDKIEILISGLKKSSPELYRSLIKNKKSDHPVLWKHFLTKYTGFLSQLYPCIIIDNDDLVDLENGAIDELICYNEPNVNIDIMNKFGSLISFFPYNDTMNNSDYSLSKEHVPSYSTLQQIHTTGRISLIRNIADEMLQFNNNPSVFRLRNATIISFCSDYYNDCMHEYFYTLGIKKLTSEETIKETLIGALIDTDTMVYVMTEDYLLHPATNNSDFLYQRLVVKRLEEFGCIFHTIDSRVTFESKGLNLLNIFAGIKSELLSENIIKTQLTIEFL